DHRVRERKGLGGREATEVDRHQERGHLVVRHLAARVAQHELAQLLGGELRAVPLALDQLRRGCHAAFSATKTYGDRRTRSGPSNCGRSPPSVIVASTNACAAARSGNTNHPVASRRSTRANRCRSNSSAFSAEKHDSGRSKPTSSDSPWQWAAPFVTATRRPPGRSTRADAAIPP